MLINNALLYSATLEYAIDANLLIVAPDTPLTNVLALMSEARSCCNLPVAGSATESYILSEMRASCVLVAEGVAGYCRLPNQSISKSQILGIFTERDIVKLTAAGKDLKNFTVAEVMSAPAITLTKSESQGIFTALALFRQHRIRHLPIVDKQGQLLGIVTPETIRRALQPANLLTRLRSVKDVMNPQVIQALPSASVFELAKLMAEHQVSCIVIVEKKNTSYSIPVGIVTERDILQFQALELNLSKLRARDIMSTPLFCLSPDNSLWEAHQQMQKRHVRRLVVTGCQGELLGIVSQTSLLQALDPREMYGIIEILQQVVEERTSELKQINERLQQEILVRQQAEKALLQARDNLQRQVEERTAELRAINARLLQDIWDRQRVEDALRQSEAQLRQQAQQLQKALHELQQTQSQLIQAEKMSSLGQLVAGIAHEINNPVNFIYGNLSYAAQYIEDLLYLLKLYRQAYPNPTPEIIQQSEKVDLEFLMADLPKLLNSMKVGAERIRQIVLSLRNFSRLDEADKKRVDIHEGIDSTLLILQHRLKGKQGLPPIQVIKDYSILPPVDCYAGTLNQVFMNILSNAIDAIEQAYSQQKNTNTDDKNSSISSNSECPLPMIRIRTEMIENERVVVRIADNGVGMPESVRSRLFEPFFTTKPVGKGTGLGLSISYQIVVEKHHGRLECISEPGKGTEFIIEIPIKQQKRPQTHLFLNSSPQANDLIN